MEHCQCAGEVKGVLTSSKGGCYMLVVLASPRWRWCPGEYSLVLYARAARNETPEYSPGHQHHIMGESNKTNI